MKKILTLIFAITALNCFSQNKESVQFLIADSNHTVHIFIDKNTDSLIVWAVNELADDIKEITGKRPEIVTTNKVSKKGIYVGQISSKLFQSKNNQKELENQWEKLSIKKEKAKDIQICFIALNRKGEAGAYALHKGFNYAVHTKDGNKLFESSSLD